MNTTRSASISNNNTTGLFAQGNFTDNLQQVKEKTTINDIKNQIKFEKTYKKTYRKQCKPKVDLREINSIEESINIPEFDMVQMNIGLNHGLVTTHNKQRNTARVKMIETDFGSYEI